MAGDDKDFQDSINARTAKGRAQDYDDLNNELADRETGRNGRFFNKAENITQEKERKRTTERVFLNALEKLLQDDPDYAARYSEVMDLLSHAEVATEQALQEAQQDLSQGQGVLNDMRGNANRLPDGTAVYRDANGDVWTEDGRRIEGDELEGIVWKERAPSYEDVLKQKQMIEEARRRIDELRRYQVEVLGKSRDHMTDPDNPPSQDMLDNIQKDIEDKAPLTVRQAIKLDTPEVEHMKTTSHEIDVLKF